MEPHIRAVRSVKLPVLPPEVKTLVDMIDEGETCDAIFRQLCQSSLAAGFVSQIDNDEGRVLFHTMSLSLLRSLLMQTLGVHLYSVDATRKNWDSSIYDDDGAGSYAAFIYVRDRSGAFLNSLEIEELIESLRRYARGIDAYHANESAYGFSQASSQDLADIDFCQVIDDKLRKVNHFNPEKPEREMPRFGPRHSHGLAVDKDGSTNVRNLIAMFQDRCAPDPESEAIVQIQSPILVGNAGWMRSRILSHFADGTMNKSAKVLGLTVSCLRTMGVRAEVQVAPLFRVWREEQVDLAEVLGTLLAGSLLPGRGFNVKQPGTRGIRPPGTSNETWEDSKTHVFYHKSWFGQNLDRSIAALPPAIDPITHPSFVGLHRALRDADSQNDKLLEAIRELKEARLAYDEQLSQAKAESTAAQELNREMRELINSPLFGRI
ncbi:hypothetical protein GGR56DRAFT_671187 [Xylariaceae sp. FL0804]|nr:hypothetical protein GGR56DRAFT_671187 [Xylariaceae sp. FL0804]